MASMTYTVDMVFEAHIKGILDAVVNVLVVEITDIFRTCLALEQHGVYHAGSYVGFADPAELQQRLRESLKNIRQSGPSPERDEQFSTAMSSPAPPDASRQTCSPDLPKSSSAHREDVTDSRVIPDLPVVIEMFSGDAHVLFSELTSDQDDQRMQHWSLQQESQGPQAVHAQTEYEANSNQEKEQTAVCPSLQPASLSLPSCSVQLDRLSRRLTQKNRTLFVCPDCAKIFRCMKSHGKHRRFHSGETHFHCPQCPRKFILRKSLRLHQRQHTGKKPYRCLRCGKAFRLRKRLEKHMRSHNRDS